MYVVAGLRAANVDVWAIVPEMWLSDFVLAFFLQVWEPSQYRGGAAKIFNLYNVVFLN